MCEPWDKWPRNESDNFILKALIDRGLEPAAEATRQVQIRRLYYDLIGLPPSLDQVRQFVEDDSPQAYEQLVDHLLDSPRYGERWARHWLDRVQPALCARFGFRVEEVA